MFCDFNCGSGLRFGRLLGGLDSGAGGCWWIMFSWFGLIAARVW